MIMLGEPTHGDGSAFQLRSELTQALAEQAGFSGLALEALGAFESAKSLQEGSARLWTGSNEAWPGLDWALDRHAAGELSLQGMDVQHRNVEDWWRQTFNVIETASADTTGWSATNGTLNAAFSNPFAPIDPDRQRLIRESVRSFTAQLRQSGHEEEAQFLENALANAATAWEQSYQPRNLQMAENLLFMMDREGPVIVWGASSHLVRDLQVIDTMTDQWSYDGSLTVGNHVADALGEDLAVVAFTACSGEYGAEHIGMNVKPVSEPTPGSLEDLICRLPFDRAAFLNLKTASSILPWLHAPFRTGVLGYAPKLASWPRVIDGLIVMRRMSPSTPRTAP